MSTGLDTTYEELKFPFVKYAPVVIYRLDTTYEELKYKYFNLFFCRLLRLDTTYEELKSPQPIFKFNSS